MEAEYASESPFLNYGIDLADMAELEKGIPVTHESNFVLETDIQVGQKKQEV